MKKLLLFLFLFALIGFTVNAAPNSPYSVAGVVSISTTPIEATAVKIENTNKLTSDIVYTNQYGEYAEDLTSMPNGVSNNDNIKVTACIGDSRCYEKSETFTAISVSTSGFKRVDISATAKEPTGIATPYNIIGKVKIDGAYIPSESIELINQRTQDSKIVKTDSEGFYSFNLANFNNVYQTGDKIDIKVRWYTLTITVLANSAYLTADIDIPSTAPSSPSGSSDSGSDSGSSSKKPGTETKPGIIVDHDLSESVPGSEQTISFILGEGSSTTFTIDGTTSHKLTVLKLTSGSATIQIESEPIVITLLVGESRRLDLDYNGKYDLEVTLSSIKDKKAEITMRKLKAEVESSLPDSNEETVILETTESTGKSSGAGWIIAFVVIIAIIIGIVYFFKKRSD